MSGFPALVRVVVLVVTFVLSRLALVGDFAGALSDHLGSDMASSAVFAAGASTLRSAGMRGAPNGGRPERTTVRVWPLSCCVFGLLVASART